MKEIADPHRPCGYCCAWSDGDDPKPLNTDGSPYEGELSVPHPECDAAVAAYVNEREEP